MKIFKNNLVVFLILCIFILSGCNSDDSSNSAPAIISSATVSVNENQIGALTVTATDANPITFSLSGTDASSFDINAISGVVTFKIAPDYEIKNSYSFTANASDVSLSSSQSVTISINNIAEVPTLATFTGSVDENATIGTEIGNITITDVGDTNITAFSISDTTNFEINASGYIKTKTIFNYESNTIYALEVNATNLAGDSVNVNLIININDIGDFYIRAAVYDNNATVTPVDDKLYIYFDHAINPVSVAADMSINYTLEGIGVIGTASTSVYDNTRFYQHIISLNSDGSASIALVANDTNISIATNVLQDTSGNYTIYDANKTIVEKFRVILKTGQTTSYPDTNASDRDDGYYETGKTRSYTDNGDTITDNATGLIWQEEDDNVARSWANASTYCNSITLDGNSNFRLPTIEELVQLTDKSKSSPSIDGTIFTNTKSSDYFSSTTNAQSTIYALVVNFTDGFDGVIHKDISRYIRCVR